MEHPKTREVVSLMRSQQVNLCFLVETKVKEKNREKVLRQSFRDRYNIDNYECHENCKIWIS